MGGILYENIWHFALMSLLLMFSAFFSGCETAFSNLTPRQRSQFRKSSHRLQRLAAAIAENPKQLLTSLLFGNMVVNTLFYATASVLVIGVERRVGATAATITAGLTFLAVIIFGEMLPKSASYVFSSRISVLAALPCFAFLRLTQPIRFLINFLFVGPAIKLLSGPVSSGKPIPLQEVKLLIESSRQQGLITAEENQLLSEIIEFGLLKVRHVMKPRVDMINCDVRTATSLAKQLMLSNKLTKLPIYAGSIDNIVGAASLKDILLRPGEPLERLVRKVNFVPEQRMIETLPEFFKQNKTDMAIVVDEYGGIAGSVSFSDVIEELLGPIEQVGVSAEIEQIGPMQYRLAGSTAIQDWSEAFGINAEDIRLSTIGGFVVSLLGRIPREGDTAMLKNLKFTVEKVKKHRIESVVLSVEPQSNGNFAV